MTNLPPVCSQCHQTGLGWTQFIRYGKCFHCRLKAVIEKLKRNKRGRK